ncbi:hypothetical protein F2P79_003860 [Pimephales promelas]|nr:hypothetical protein F2P79_003860 [Pimephales promelas]
MESSEAKSHFPALGQDLHNAVSSVRMGHADFPVRERAIESPAAITQKHLHRHAAAATVFIFWKMGWQANQHDNFSLIDSDKSSTNGKDSEYLGAVVDTSLVSPGVNVARFLQLIAALLMTGHTWESCSLAWAMRGC